MQFQPDLGSVLRLSIQIPRMLLIWESTVLQGIDNIIVIFHFQHLFNFVFDNFSAFGDYFLQTNGEPPFSRGPNGIRYLN